MAIDDKNTCNKIVLPNNSPVNKIFKTFSEKNRV